MNSKEASTCGSLPRISNAGSVYVDYDMLLAFKLLLHLLQLSFTEEHGEFLLKASLKILDTERWHEERNFNLARVLGLNTQVWLLFLE